MTIESAFNDTIEYYDDWMKKALPSYVDIFRTAQELVPFESTAPIEVLDLGAGTGLFSQHIVEKFLNASFILYDLADKMLGIAKERFRASSGKFEYVVGDYRQMQVPHKFDLVISSLSIHHLADAEKRELFRDIYAVLRAPGIFLNVDQIRGESGYVRDLYWNRWLAQVRRNEPSEERIRDSIERRTTYDRDATLADQLRWLAEAGFGNVDCVYKNFFVGVFLAMKE